MSFLTPLIYSKDDIINLIHQEGERCGREIRTGILGYYYSLSLTFPEYYLQEIDIEHCPITYFKEFKLVMWEALESYGKNFYGVTVDLKIYKHVKAIEWFSTYQQPLDNKTTRFSLIRTYNGIL